MKQSLDTTTLQVDSKTSSGERSNGPFNLLHVKQVDTHAWNVCRIQHDSQKYESTVLIASIELEQYRPIQSSPVERALFSK